MQRTQGEFNGWGALLVGAFSALLGIAFAIDNSLFLRAAVTAEGRVVANRVQGKKRPQDPTYYLPLVRFTDERGVDHDVEAQIATDTRLPLGTKLPVLYPPGRPERARVGSDFYWGWTIGLFGLGAFFAAFGLLLVIGSRWLVRLGVPMKPAGKLWPF